MRDPSDPRHPMFVVDIETSSHRQLDAQFRIPDIIEQLSLGHQLRSVMPANLDPVTNCSKYVVLSDGGCQCQFHQDFTGTSVMYLVVTGEKHFWMVRPTATNLALLREWRHSENSRYICICYLSQFHNIFCLYIYII